MSIDIDQCVETSSIIGLQSADDFHDIGLFQNNGRLIMNAKALVYDREVGTTDNLVSNGQEFICS